MLVCACLCLLVLDCVCLCSFGLVYACLCLLVLVCAYLCLLVFACACLCLFVFACALLVLDFARLYLSPVGARDNIIIAHISFNFGSLDFFARKGECFKGLFWDLAGGTISRRLQATI